GRRRDSGRKRASCGEGVRAKETEGRFPGECYWKAKPSKCPTFWPIRNTPTAQARRLAAIVRFSASHCCEKERRLASSPWGETRCGHSPTSKLNWLRPLPTRR